MHGYNPLFGRETAQIQPPTHTADPIPFFFVQKRFICYPELLKVRNDEVRTRYTNWLGMVGLT